MPDLPPPSAEGVIIRVGICALIEVLGPKKSRALLQAMARSLASEEALSTIVPIRGASQQAAVARARKEAIAMFSAQLPMFLAALGKVER